MNAIVLADYFENHRGNALNKEKSNIKCCNHKTETNKTTINEHVQLNHSYS
jgi:hypothetical protein